MVRMRTLPQVMEYLRSQDPDTSLTEWYIRGLVKSGAIPCHAAGKKVLINLDALEAFLANPPKDPPQEYGKVRRIGLR